MTPQNGVVSFDEIIQAGEHTNERVDGMTN